MINECESVIPHNIKQSFKRYNSFGRCKLIRLVSWFDNASGNPPLSIIFYEQDEDLLYKDSYRI